MEYFDPKTANDSTRVNTDSKSISKRIEVAFNDILITVKRDEKRNKSALEKYRSSVDLIAKKHRLKTNNLMMILKSDVK